MNNVSDFLINTALILTMYICVILLGIYAFVLLQHIFEIDCNNIPITSNIKCISRNFYE